MAKNITRLDLEVFFDKAQEKTHELMDELELQGDGGTTAVSAALTALIFRILINSPSVPVATGLIAVCMQNAAVMAAERTATTKRRCTNEPPYNSYLSRYRDYPVRITLVEGPVFHPVPKGPDGTTAHKPQTKNPRGAPKHCSPLLLERIPLPTLHSTCCGSCI